jgi:hypothetical protein
LSRFLEKFAGVRACGRRLEINRWRDRQADEERHLIGIVIHQVDPRRQAFDIQLMFFFHDTPREMGGTMILPGSHLRRVNEAAIARYQNFVGQLPIVCPAGTLVVAHHGIWHCGQPNLTDRPRTMFKLRLGPRVAQRRLWDTRDIDDPQILKIRARASWYGTGAPRDGEPHPPSGARWPTTRASTSTSGSAGSRTRLDLLQLPQIPDRPAGGAGGHERVRAQRL